MNRSSTYTDKTRQDKDKDKEWITNQATHVIYLGQDLDGVDDFGVLVINKGHSFRLEGGAGAIEGLDEFFEVVAAGCFG